MISQIKELSLLRNKVKDEITIGYFQSKEIGKGIPILISSITVISGLILSAFGFFEYDLLQIFHSIQSYFLVSFIVLMVIITGLFCLVIKRIIESEEAKKKNSIPPIKLLVYQIGRGEIVATLTIALFITFIVASIPLIYSFIFIIPFQHTITFLSIIIVLITSLIFLILNKLIYNKLNSVSIIKSTKIFLHYNFLLEKSGYILTLFAISLFSLFIFMEFLITNLNILRSYQFWISSIFILFIYLSIASTYSYIHSKGYLSKRIKNLLIQYYLIELYIKRNQSLERSDITKLKNGVAKNLSPVIILSIQLLWRVPLFFKVDLEKI